MNDRGDFRTAPATPGLLIIIAQSKVQLSATSPWAELIFPHIMQGKMSLNLVIVMMGQVMGWQCEFFFFRQSVCNGMPFPESLRMRQIICNAKVNGSPDLLID